MSSSRLINSTPMCLARSAETKGSYATRRIPKARARWATRAPTRPRPTTPRVLPCSSTPSHLDRSHLPATRAEWAWGMLRAWANRRAMACSAAERMFDWGALTTITPRSVAAVTSTLSRPMPARPTTTRSVPAASTSAVTVVAERMTRACAPTTAESSCSGERSSCTSTSWPASAISCRPAGASFSVTSTLPMVILSLAEASVSLTGRRHEASPNSLARRETPSTRSSSPRAYDIRK